MDVPQFETKRLLLKAVEQKHLASYAKHFVTYEVIRYLSDSVPWPYPANGVESFFLDLQKAEKDSEWMWGLFLKENPDDMVGCVHLWREGKPENRGFWLGKKFWGQGLMTEAVAPVVEHAFTNLGFEELIFSNAKGNVGSRRIKEKTGCTLLRTEPASFVDPTLSEREVWQLTKADWVKLRA